MATAEYLVVAIAVGLAGLYLARRFYFTYIRPARVAAESRDCNCSAARDLARARRN